MSQDIRFAGLNERLYRQLLQTLHFLSTPGKKARISEWNGRQCDVVVADSRNQFGEYVINTAGERGIPLVAVTRDSHSVADVSVQPTIPAPRLSDAIDSALSGKQKASGVLRSALIRVATEPELRGSDIDLAMNGRVAQLRPRLGRVFASSHRDLRRLAGQLGEEGWTVHETTSNASHPAAGAVSMSLEAFYLIGANLATDHLPVFPDKELSLTDCPDLGSAADLQYPLLVTDVLCHEASTPHAIAEQTYLPSSVVSACLWAFRASGLLQVQRNAEPAFPESQHGRLVEIG